MIPFPAIDPVAVWIPVPGLGEFPIRWYALSYIAAFIVGNWLMIRLVKKYPAPNLTPEEVERLFVWLVLGVILGGRLGFVLFYNLPHYMANPHEVLMTWQGGMAFHGGFIGVVVATALFCWRNKIHPLDVGDKVAMVVPIGLFFGRIANFINGELWGRKWDGPWAMVFPRDPLQAPRHPSQLYEAFLEGIVLLVVLYSLGCYQQKLKLGRGFVFGAFMAFYGLFRFLVEFVREPDIFAYIETSWITTGQVLSLPMLLIGVGIMVYARKSATR